ncbi:MAG: dihydroneopterin aldolase [Bacteroidia bacterium]
MGLSILGRIGVENMELYMCKGLYPGEKLVENHFKISADVYYKHSNLKAGEYLNYERLCQIIRDEMNKEEHLLETVAENILIAIMEEWSIAESSNVKILKMHPRFVGIETEALKVELSANR